MNQPEAAEPITQTQRVHSFRSSEFSWFFIPVAVACVFCGFVFEYGGHSVLAVLCYVGATVGLFGHSGFQIDTEFKQQRFYLSYVGLKLGGWQPLRNYDRICVRLCRGRARRDGGKTTPEPKFSAACMGRSWG